ncbi:MAG: hypothetical protein PHH07_03340 [Candidatus Cloacimonetes bacterium]|nr:hypothetical protein [Candidatus Cloacimonadota bacterium]
MKYISTLMLLFALLLASCDPDTTAADEYEIRNIIYGISRDFSWGEVDGIMVQVHPDFRHKGMYSTELRQLWENRRGQYQLLECEISDVEVNYDRATVFMTMTFQSSTSTYSYPEPETFGDASYFIYEGGSWQLYGDQTWRRAFSGFHRYRGHGRQSIILPAEYKDCLRKTRFNKSKK